MTRRQVLNISSVKKRDNMQPLFINDTHDGVAAGPTTLIGNQLYGFLFSPSARRSAFTPTQYARNATNTFCRGYKETSTFESNGGQDWMWRRIVFLCKDEDIQNAFPPNTIDFENADDGYYRTHWNFLNGNTDADTARDALYRILFQGTRERDWSNAWAASVNTQRVTLVSDKLRTISGDTGHAHFWTYKGWFPINKSIVYDDREDGGPNTDFKETEPWSTTGKPGAGNLFVCDLLVAAGSNSEQQLIYHNKGTYYWHERSS